MRSEQEMMHLILEVARNDERVRAVYMNGSRTNPCVEKDIFQDYDVVYVVNDTLPFRQEVKWIDRFGKRLYMQYPEDNVFYPSDVENNYGWLIQFADGNRLDLHVQTIALAKEEVIKERLCRILLDKDNCMPEIPESTDEDFWVKKPTKAEYANTCNEFWWCLNNIAKGLWRHEIPYTMDMLNYVVRPQLTRMLKWKIGYLTDFSVSVGKSGKYMHKWLDESSWEQFLQTYPTGKIESLWESVYTACDLFDKTARDIAKHMGIDYNETEATNSYHHLKHVASLSKDANEIYPSI